MKRYAFQTIRPVISRENAVFPLTLGRAALCRRLAFLPFSKVKRSKNKSAKKFCPLKSKTARRLMPTGCFFVSAGFHEDSFPACNVHFAIKGKIFLLVGIL
ncbi:hypothetical protein QUW15_14035 [Desulfovibrio piger]|nr:hypothetical protein [Desulfovibrio piger]